MSDRFYREKISPEVLSAAPLPQLEPGETISISAQDVDRINSHCAAMRSDIAVLSARAAVAEALLERADEALSEHICHATSADEHPPNEVCRDIREFLARWASGGAS